MSQQEPGARRQEREARSREPGTRSQEPLARNRRPATRSTSSRFDNEFVCGVASSSLCVLLIHSYIHTFVMGYPGICVIVHDVLSTRSNS